MTMVNAADVRVGEQDGDMVLALALSPDFARDGVCFAGRQSGLYRSADGGLTWRPAYESLHLAAALTTTAVALSPDFEGDRSLFAGVPGAVLRSLDGGERWSVAPLPLPPPVVSALAVSPDYERDGTVLAGTVEDGVFRSADRGVSWSAWNFGLLDLGVLALAISPAFARDETLYAGTESGLFRSTNGGRAWREVEPAGEFAPVLSLALSPGYERDGVVLAGTEAHGLLRSGDQGRSWARLDEGVIASAVNAVLPARDYPATPELVVMLDVAILRSRDGGRSWATWHTADDSDGVLTAIAAPGGLNPDTPLLVGLAGGGVRRVRLAEGDTQ